MRISPLAMTMVATFPLALASAGAQESNRLLSLRVTEFELREPERVRAFNDARDEAERAKETEQAQLASELNELMKSSAPSDSTVLSAEDRAALSGIGFRNVNGRLVSPLEAALESAERDFNERAWEATRGLSPRTETLCTIRENGEAVARVWNDQLGRMSRSTYRAGAIEDGSVQVVESFVLLDQPVVGQPESAMEWGPPTKRWSKLALGRPTVGQQAGGGGSVSVTFNEVQVLTSNDRASECSVRYAPEAAPPQAR